MTFRHYWPIFAALTLLAGPVCGDGNEPPFRLSQTVIPESYRLDLTIVPDQERFSGHAEIDITITEPVDVIWLHGRDLAVHKVEIVTRAGERVAATYEQVAVDGMARIVPGRTLSPQRVTVSFDYDAKFGSSLNGLYKVRVGEDAYAFSQLESIAARKVFPSFDEPRFKTVYKISVTTRDSYRAFSNTAAVEITESPDGMQKITYAPTEPLPTYLIAFAVGPLDVVEWAPVAPTAYRAEPLPLRGIAVRGQGPRMTFALENTAPLLQALESYFGIAYPFDKLDIVAVPDFASGAMENAGLITYREPLVLFSEQPAVNQIRRYAMVHAHELAHQWFGNLVTMPWWDDIWLNESFASWIEAKIAQQWGPQYNFAMETQADAIYAMGEDSLVSARQIRQPVESTADIKNAFDAITYMKGAGVLRMLEHYLGQDAFRSGLRGHMQRHAFGLATVYDLIESLQGEVAEDAAVQAVFESFLFQPGVPYLRVDKQCSDQAVRIHVSQQRFLPIGSGGDPDQRWTVPVCFAYGETAGEGKRFEHCVLLTDENQSFPLATAECPTWLMPNADGAGYFRWRLEPDEFASLAAVLPTALNAGEQLSFVDSLLAGVSNGAITMSAFLQTLPVIVTAEDRNVVTEPLAAYRRMMNELIEPDHEAAARDYGKKLFMPRLQGLDADAQGNGALQPSADAAVLRYQLTRFLAVDLQAMELREGLTNATHRYMGYGRNIAPDLAALDPDLLRPALIVAVQDSEPGFVEFLIESFRASRDARFRQAAMEALAFATDSAAVKTAREFALGADVRGNELDTWLYWLLNPASRKINWPWVQANLDEILATGGDRIGREAPFMFGRWLCSADDAATLEGMFASRVDAYPGSERNLARALESIRLCVAFRAQQSASANEFFFFF